MQGIEFEEEDISMVKKVPTEDSSKMVQTLKKIGIVKTENQAYLLLFLIILSCFILSGIITYMFILPHKSSKQMVNPNIPSETHPANVY